MPKAKNFLAVNLFVNTICNLYVLCEEKKKIKYNNNGIVILHFIYINPKKDFSNMIFKMSNTSISIKYIDFKNQN